ALGEGFLLLFIRYHTQSDTSMILKASFPNTGFPLPIRSMIPSSPIRKTHQNLFHSARVVVSAPIFHTLRCGLFSREWSGISIGNWSIKRSIGGGSQRTTLAGKPKNDGEVYPCGRGHEVICVSEFVLISLKAYWFWVQTSG